MQKFVLLADRRSGTTLVIDCLTNLPRVSCEKRAFGIDKKVENPTKDHHSGMFFLYRSETLGRKLRFWTGRKALIREFLDERVFGAEGPEDIRGFRLIYNKADQHPEILDGRRRKNIDLDTWGRKGGEIVERAAELGDVVPRLLADPRDRSEIRRAIARDLFHRPGDAARRALRTLYDDLELDPPAGLRDVAAAAVG